MTEDGILLPCCVHAAETVYATRFPLAFCLHEDWLRSHLLLTAKNGVMWQTVSLRASLYGPFRGETFSMFVNSP